MKIAFYEHQPPWDKDPGGICSYVIERAKLLGSAGVEVWWCNASQSAIWNASNQSWIARRDYPNRRFPRQPAAIAALDGQVDAIEVSESAPILRKLNVSKLIVHWHTATSVRALLNQDKLNIIRNGYQNLRENRLLSLADQFVAPSVEMVLIQAGHYGIHPDRVYVLPHYFSSNPSCRSAQAAEGYVLMAGNLEYFKGFDLLAAAMDMHLSRGGKLKLLFAGTSGPGNTHPHYISMMNRPEVRRCCERHGEDWVRFLGRISHEELNGYQAKANATVVASRFENFTMVVGEAVQCGCPILLSDRCGWRMPAALSQGAMIVDPYDAEALADALDRVANPANRDALVASSRRLAEWISSPELAAKTIAFYRDVVKSPTP